MSGRGRSQSFKRPVSNSRGSDRFRWDGMFLRFALYGFLKNLRFFEPFFLLFFRDAGLSFLRIGVLYSVRDLASNLLELPAGVFADAFGRRRSMVIAFLAYICSFLVIYSFSSYVAFVMAMILFAVGEAFRSGTHKALILEHLRIREMLDKKVAYYGSTRAASQLGSAVNSLIAAGLVLYTGDYRHIFLASIIPYIIDLVNLATYPAELDGNLDRSKPVREQVRDTVAAFVGIFRSLGAMRAILNTAVLAGFFKSSKDYLQPILKVFALSLPVLIGMDDTRRSAVIIGLVYFVIYLSTSWASRNSVRFVRPFPSQGRALNVTFLAGGLSLLVAGWARWLGSDVVAIATLMVLYLVQNVRKPIGVAVVSDQIPDKVMASGLSVEAQVTTMLMVLLAPILGALADYLGVGPALGILGLTLVALLPLVRVVEDNGRQAAEQPGAG